MAKLAHALPGPRSAPWSSRRGCHGCSGCLGAAGRGPARIRAAARRTGPGRRPDPPPAPPSGRARAERSGARVLRAEDPLLHEQQPGVQVSGSGRIPRVPGPASEAGAGGQGVRVLCAEDRWRTDTKPCEQVPSGGRIPRLTGPAGQPRVLRVSGGCATFPPCRARSRTHSFPPLSSQPTSAHSPSQLAVVVQAAWRHALVSGRRPKSPSGWYATR